MNTGGVLFYVSVVGFAGGIFLRSFFDIGLPVIIWFLGLGVIVGVMWWHGKRRKNGAFLTLYLLSISLFLILFSIGAFRFELANMGVVNEVYESQIGEKIVFEGIVAREPDVRESSQHLYVKVDLPLEAGDELILVTTNRYQEIDYGDFVSVEGVLKKPESFVTDLGRTFDYPEYLHARGVSYIVRFANVKVMESEKGNVIVASLLTFKHKFMEKIELTITEPHVGLSEGLLLGVKRALGENLEEVFRKTGIIHIVVLSGYNVMIVVAFVMYIFAYLFGMRVRLIFGIIAISSFALIVGLSATVVRASIMASMILVARATGRTYAVMRALMIAGIIMLLINPYLLAFDTGFQLSFLATMGLILVAPYIEKRLKLVPTKVGMREFLTATLATQLFVMPILLYQIGEFSVVSVVVNVLVLPMVPVAMLLTFITGMLGFISTTLALPFAYLTYISLAYIIGVAERFASLPFASYIVPPFPFWVVAVAYAGMGFILWRLWNRGNNLTKHDSPTVVNVNKEESDELEGWIIEEDKEMKSTQLSVGTETKADSPATISESSDSETEEGKDEPTDTPIFFR